MNDMKRYNVLSNSMGGVDEVESESGRYVRAPVAIAREQDMRDKLDSWLSLDLQRDARLTVAEQRNSELIALLLDIKNSHGILLPTNPIQDPWLNNRIDQRISSVLNKADAGAYQ